MCGMRSTLTVLLAAELKSRDPRVRPIPADLHSPRQMADLTAAPASPLRTSGNIIFTPAGPAREDLDGTWSFGVDVQADEERLLREELPAIMLEVVAVAESNFKATCGAIRLNETHLLATVHCFSDVEKFTKHHGGTFRGFVHVATPYGCRSCSTREGCEGLR